MIVRSVYIRDAFSSSFVDISVADDLAYRPILTLLDKTSSWGNGNYNLCVVGFFSLKIKMLLGTSSKHNAGLKITAMPENVSYSRLRHTVKPDLCDTQREH